MRVTIMAIGSRGDVQPLVALGVGLQQRGHQVRIVAGDEFAALVTGAQCGFVPLGLNIQAAMAEQSDFIRFAHSITARVLRAAEAPQDAIISTVLGVSACQMARARGIPFFYVVPIPSLYTREFPAPLFPPWPLGGVYNALTHRLTEGLIKRSYPYAQSLFLEPRPTYLFCFSALVVPRPNDWPGYAHVTGYWFLERPTDWQPPAELVAFLEGGPPPICIGFGSMRSQGSARVTEMVLAALARSKQRGILVSGWGELNPQRLPPEVFLVDAVPFDWLFARVAAAVHHGGAGTMATALRAGIPSVVVPFGIDQPFWGRQVQRLGIGPTPLPLKRLNAERLAEAIGMAVTDESMRAQAAYLGARIRNEDGVGNAVSIIEQVVAR